MDGVVRGKRFHDICIQVYFEVTHSPNFLDDVHNILDVIIC
jgi:hypothetical protein